MILFAGSINKFGEKIRINGPSYWFLIEEIITFESKVINLHQNGLSYL